MARNAGYIIIKRGFIYDVRCNYCNFHSPAWDYRRNAVAVGKAHVLLGHQATFLQHTPVTYLGRIN